MHTNGTIGDDSDDTVIYKDRSKIMGIDNFGDSGSHGAGYAVGCLSGTTLTERVLRFMERYDKSTNGYG